MDDRPMEQPVWGGWMHLSDDHAMNLEAASWLARGGRPVDPTRNGQFLALFALYLVRQFRTEEALLRQGKAQDLKRRCLENHRLALQLRDLMADLEQSLDGTAEIRTFLQAWRQQRQRASARRVA